MTKNVYPSRKISSKGQVSCEELNVKFTGEYQDGYLSRIIIEPEENQENGYSEDKAREVIKESMYDCEEYTPVGKEL